MTRWNYVRQCVVCGLHSAWGKAGTVSTAFTVLGAISPFCTPLNEIMAILAWLIPLTVMVTTFFISLLVASYRIYREKELADAADREKLINEFHQRDEAARIGAAALTAEIDRLRKENDRLLRSSQDKERRRHVAAEADAILGEGNAVMQSLLGLDAATMREKVDAWVTRAAAFIDEHFPDQRNFFMDSGLGLQGVRTGTSLAQAAEYQRLERRQQRFREIARDATG